MSESIAQNNQPSLTKEQVDAFISGLKTLESNLSKLDDTGAGVYNWLQIPKILDGEAMKLVVRSLITYIKAFESPKSFTDAIEEVVYAEKGTYPTPSRTIQYINSFVIVYETIKKEIEAKLAAP